ncbi:MAG: 3-phosphoserine/phosphohydroxythreonine transaminase [Planctomycetales bacterium]|nr:3-phosphoserine/phosphohydroxythreonine transaminase [Planctomycetales bacterium]MCA9166341.1 3-phosphoserine/phosphohydroxythreonine transaminase [Planctomycetales bacterium]
MRDYNFSAGPAVLPLPVLERAQAEMLCLPGAGASVLEISHRGKPFMAILESAKQNLKELLGIPDGYQTLFLQGGSRLQFSMVPMNLLRGQTGPADYLLTGAWGKAAYAEAVKEGEVRVPWDGKQFSYDRTPADSDYSIGSDSAYVYFTSNETIEGVQFHEEPAAGGAPLICDASSDFLHRPLDISRYGMIYACAQKNAGPAGVTIVIIRDDLVERGAKSLPGYLNYKNHVDGDSMYNTPPTFAIYLVDLIAQWLLKDIGGLDAMYKTNQEKAKMLYDVIDGSNGFYQGHAQRECRSVMNVTFRLPNEELEKKFNAEASQQRLTSLKGHRSVGGFRASIYNAMPREGVVALRDFMQDFAKQNQA